MLPLFPWTGTKRRLASTILRGITPTRVIEPFAGGASVFFRAEKPGVLIDANPHLALLYSDLRDTPHAFQRCLSHHISEDSESHYYETRYLFNRRLTRRGPLGAVVLYLILAGRNGLWRVDQSGALNTPYGKRPRLSIPPHLLRAHSLLSSSTVVAGDWSAVSHYAREGDLVYFDPPYSGGGFTAYTATQFTSWVALANTATTLVARGCHVAVSDYDTSTTRPLFASWHHLSIPVTVRHNPLHPRTVTESLYLSYGSPHG